MSTLDTLFTWIGRLFSLSILLAFAAVLVSVADDWFTTRRRRNADVAKARQLGRDLTAAPRYRRNPTADVINERSPVTASDLVWLDSQFRGQS